MKKKIFSILVCLILFILPLNLSISGISAQSDELQKPTRLGIDEETSDEYTADYTLAAQNDNLLFYADMEKGWFALQNRRSGKIWYSNPNDAVLDDVTVGISRTNIFSDYIFEYYDKSTVGEASTLTFNSHTTAVRQKNVSVEKVASGIKVTYRFDTFGFTVPVIYSLLENSLEVKVCVDEIEESGNYEASSIEGASAWDNYWYITIPMLSPMIFVSLVYTVVDTFSDATNPVMSQIQTLVTSLDNGKASAMAIPFMLIILLVLALVFGVFALINRNSKPEKARR